MDEKFKVCEICGMREATEFIKTTRHGIPIVKHVCKSCQQQLEKVAELSELLSDINLFAGIVEPQVAPARMRVCKCGTTENDVLENFEFGCAECYNTFRDIAKKFVIKLGGATYASKQSEKILDEKNKIVPKVKRSEIDILRDKIKEAVASEDFLLANELKQKLSVMKQYGGE